MKALFVSVFGFKNFPPSSPPPIPSNCLSVKNLGNGERGSERERERVREGGRERKTKINKKREIRNECK